MILTVELKCREGQSPAEVAICFDEEGLRALVAKIQALHGKRDHTHLMTPSWAGNDLTEEKQGGEGYEMVNHLRLVKL